MMRRNNSTGITNTRTGITTGLRPISVAMGGQGSGVAGIIDGATVAAREYSKTRTSNKNETTGEGNGTDNNNNNNRKKKQDKTNTGNTNSENTKNTGDNTTKNDSNLLLDHLGKVFLLAIVSVIVTLVRSSYNTKNRNKIRDQLEVHAALDPLEFEEFRAANTELTLPLLQHMVASFYTDPTIPTAMTVRRDRTATGNTTDTAIFDGNEAQQQPHHQHQHYQQQRVLHCTYLDFIKMVRTIMATKIGGGTGHSTAMDEAFTLELGHYVDRMVLAIAHERNRTKEQTQFETFDTNDIGDQMTMALRELEEEEETKKKNANVNEGEAILLPVALYWTALIAAMNGSVSDRIRILHDVLSMEEQYMSSLPSSSSSSSSLSAKDNNTIVDVTDVADGAGSSLVGTTDDDTTTRTVVPLSRVRDMVGYLQATYQLPPDTQIIPTDTKYPAQQWKRASPDELVPGGGVPSEQEEDYHKTNEQVVDIVEFAAILRTKSVCAWGECYHKWKPGMEEFE